MGTTSRPSVPATVLIVDDHEGVRLAEARSIASSPGLRVVGEAGSVQEALLAVAALQPDIVVLDVRLPDGDGIEVCRKLQVSDPDVWCIVVTAVDNDETRERAARAGARAVVGKRLHGPSLVDVIRDLRTGRRVVPPTT